MFWKFVVEELRVIDAEDVFKVRNFPGVDSHLEGGAVNEHHGRVVRSLGRRARLGKSAESNKRDRGEQKCKKGITGQAGVHGGIDELEMRRFSVSAKDAAWRVGTGPLIEVAARNFAVRPLQCVASSYFGRNDNV